MSFRPLDALFAEKVAGCSVGWQSGQAEPFCNCVAWAHTPVMEMTIRGKHLHHYSASLDATWPVVAGKIAKQEGGWLAVQMGFETFAHRAYARISGIADSEHGYWNEADDLPLALVLAALRAAGITEEEIERAREALPGNETTEEAAR